MEFYGVQGKKKIYIFINKGFLNKYMNMSIRKLYFIIRS